MPQPFSCCRFSFTWGNGMVRRLPCQLWQDEGEYRRMLPITVHVFGIDIGKAVFHLVGLSKEGHIVQKKRFSRKQLLMHTVNMPACLIGIEACPGAHFLARALLAQGHNVKLIPAEYQQRGQHGRAWSRIHPAPRAGFHSRPG